MAGRTQQNTRRRKRPQPPVFNAVSSSCEDKDSDFVCPICFDMIEEAYVTKCGHSFCYKCLLQCLDQRNRCPKCNYIIERKDDIFPNFLLNELIQKRKEKPLVEHKRLRVDKQNGFASMDAIDAILEHNNLDISSVNVLLEALARKKAQLEGDSKLVQNKVLQDFLVQIREKKQEQLDQVSRDLKVIDDDLSTVNQRLSSCASPTTEGTAVNGIDLLPSTSSDADSQEGFNGSKSASKSWLNTTMAARRKKIHEHFDDLESCYFTLRNRDHIAATSSYGQNDDTLEEFTSSLSRFTRFSTFRPLATLNYASDIYNTSSIVSSIEFDKDCDYFAIAGVTKKIKVFEYGAVIRDLVDMHYPLHEMVCNSKISSITWSSYHKGLLASSDYEGTVTLWDSFTGVKSKIFQEHEKRCWSVDFNKMDPKLLASGSDDSRVKLWYTNMENSVASIEAKANVCCVKFNPSSRYHLAFGSADHCVHYYDLRNTKQALNVFKGHRKAVSYAKFVNSSEIVSASTDSQLKLWNIKKSQSIRTFKGHVNEKNFVGLATDGDFIACGSENNALYVYYKGLSKHLLSYKFDTVRNVLEKEKKEEDTNEFVSAVCWRPGSNVCVAANSHGIIKVLELV